MIAFMFCLLVVIIVVAIFFMRNKESGSAQAGSLGVNSKAKHQVVKPLPSVQSKWPELEPPINESDARTRQFDWNYARAMLQKIAYGMVGDDVPQKDKDEFKALMARFAKYDPLYIHTLKIIKGLLQKHPGLLQSQMYADADESTKETFRYVLYFAEVLNEVQRVKKGRSYQLYLVSDI